MVRLRASCQNSFRPVVLDPQTAAALHEDLPDEVALEVTLGESRAGIGIAEWDVVEDATKGNALKDSRMVCAMSASAVATGVVMFTGARTRAKASGKAKTRAKARTRTRARARGAITQRPARTEMERGRRLLPSVVA